MGQIFGIYFKRKGESSKSRIDAVLEKRTLKEEEEYRWKRRKITARGPVYGGGEQGQIVFWFVYFMFML